MTSLPVFDFDFPKTSPQIINKTGLLGKSGKSRGCRRGSLKTETSPCCDGGYELIEMLMKLGGRFNVNGAGMCILVQTRLQEANYG